MRVLHVISDSNIGGAGVLLTTLLKHFDQKRVNSEVALPKGSELIPRLKLLHIPIWELKYPCDRASLGSIGELCGIIRSDNIEIVHANAALSARIAGRLCCRTVLHTRHCCFPPKGLLRYKPFRIIGGVSNRMLSDAVIATAHAAKINLLELGIPQQRIQCIINGSDPVKEVSEAELRILRAAWRIEEKDFVVGICGRLEKCKGQEILLKAAKQLLTEYPQIPFLFLIVGGGSDAERLKALSMEYGIDERVRFTGFVKDMAPIYRLLRVNVNCSVGTETSCLALSEGMSASLPMVISDYGGNVDMLGDSGAGILFPAGDSDALTRALARIALDPALEQEMRGESFRRYLQRYTAEQMTEQLTAVYESLWISHRG